MPKHIKWRWASLIILLLIFWFSSRNASQSTMQSDSFLFLFPFLQEDIARFVIRKLAHFTIYTLLGFCVYRSFKEPCSIRAFGIAILFCFLYACTDEFHQFFIAGRSAQFRDVLIDTCGAFVGQCLSYISMKKWG